MQLNDKKPVRTYLRGGAAINPKRIDRFVADGDSITPPSKDKKPVKGEKEA